MLETANFQFLLHTFTWRCPPGETGGQYNSRRVSCLTTATTYVVVERELLCVTGLKCSTSTYQVKDLYCT